MSGEFKKEFVSYMAECTEKDYLIYQLDRARKDVVDLRAILFVSVVANIVLAVALFLK